MLLTDARDDLVRKVRPPTWTAGRWRRRASDLPPFDDKPLELVDRDEVRAPIHLQSLDERENAAVERRGTDAECLGRLGSRVGEPLDVSRLADDYPLAEWIDRQRRVALRFLRYAPESAA